MRKRRSASALVPALLLLAAVVGVGLQLLSLAAWRAPDARPYPAALSVDMGVNQTNLDALLTGVVHTN